MPYHILDDPVSGDSVSNGKDAASCLRC
jgi:hypothetical protein